MLARVRAAGLFENRSWGGTGGEAFRKVNVADSERNDRGSNQNLGCHTSILPRIDLTQHPKIHFLNQKSMCPYFLFWHYLKRMIKHRSYRIVLFRLIYDPTSKKKIHAIVEILIILLIRGADTHFDSNLL